MSEQGGDGAVACEFSDLRAAAGLATRALVNAVRDACPGEHRVEQHRDRRPPWCRACGRDNTGVQRHPAPTSPGASA